MLTLRLDQETENQPADPWQLTNCCEAPVSSVFISNLTFCELSVSVSEPALPGGNFVFAAASSDPLFVWVSVAAIFPKTITSRPRFFGTDRRTIKHGICLVHYRFCRANN